MLKESAKISGCNKICKVHEPTKCVTFNNNNIVYLYHNSEKLFNIIKKIFSNMKQIFQ